MQGRIGALDDEGFSHVGSKARSARVRSKIGGRGRKSGGAAKAAAVAAAAAAGAGADAKETERLVSNAVAGVERASRELKSSVFFEALQSEVFTAVADAPSRRWVIACLGLGSPIGSAISQWQLACLGCSGPADVAAAAAAAAAQAAAATRRARQQWRQLTQSEHDDADAGAQPSTGAGAIVASAQGEGVAGAGAACVATASTGPGCGADDGEAPLPSLLLFMPHCPAQLYDAVVGFAAADGRLVGSVLVGNAMSMYMPEDAAAAGGTSTAAVPSDAAAATAAEGGRRRRRRRGAAAPHAASPEAPTASTCPIVQEMLRSGSLPCAGTSSARPPLVVTEARVDVDGAGRRREFGACARDAAAGTGLEPTRLASLGVQTHPSAKGDPVLLAFTGTAVHRFRPASR